MTLTIDQSKKSTEDETGMKTVTFDELRAASAAMLQVNMNLKDGERVAYVSDTPSEADWAEKSFIKLKDIAQRSLMVKRLFEMMQSEFNNNTVDLICFPQLDQSGKEPPPVVAERLLGYDVLIIMTTHSLSHTNARERASEQGARVASMPGVEASMFESGGPMAADYQSISIETYRLAEMLSQGNEVHITTPIGTDLSFSISGRKGLADTGLLHDKGQFGNLPGGEAYIAPVEGTAVGKLVVPAGWYPDLMEDMTLIFEKGYVKSISGGGEVGQNFKSLFAFDDQDLKHRRNCAELGIGTNPNARRPDNVLEAEKIKGTIHIAVGDSSHMGGTTVSDLHEDFILVSPTLTVDGVKKIG